MGSNNGSGMITPGEKTGAQVGAGPWPGDALWPAAGVSPGDYALYRRMLADPTIALARASVMGPIMAAGWSVQARGDAPPGAVELIHHQLDPLRTMLLREALRAVDHGWAGFEKVFTHRVIDGRRRIVLERLKPLLVDITDIIIDRATGRFAGFRQGTVTVDAAHALLYSYDREGDAHHGRSRLENCRAAWEAWQQAQKAAAAYDRKVAGVFVVIHYPPGSSIGPGGQQRDNFAIARDLAESLSAGKPIIIPKLLDALADDRALMDPSQRAWTIELMEDKGGRQGDFIERLRYLDALKVRGYLRPERSVLEAAHGTRADADAHGDVALTDAELLYGDIVAQLNREVVDQLLALNYGQTARGSVWLKPAPLRGPRLATLRAMVQRLSAEPQARQQMLARLDLDAVFDLLELPRASYGSEVQVQ